MRWPAHPVRTAAEHPDCGGASGLQRSIRAAAATWHEARPAAVRFARSPRALACPAMAQLLRERRIVAPMILGMSTGAFTLLHVAISLIAIACCLAFPIGLWRARRIPGWTAVSLVTTIATSVTGFP